MTIHDEEQQIANGDDASLRTHSHHVEIATLSMPAVATAAGVQSGDGTNFILEAPMHVIDQLAGNTEEGQQQEQQQQQKQPCIEGVVDLDVVSHLLTGISEEEFAGLLHHDMPHADPHHKPAIAASEITELDTTPDELRKSSDSKFIGSEGQPLVRASSITVDNATTACLSLSADPFVQTLLEIHHVEDKDSDKQGKEIEGDNEATSFSTNALGSSYRTSYIRGDQHRRAGSTICREAFLLSVPKRTDGGGSYYSGGSGIGGTSIITTEDQFVLALPEMGHKVAGGHEDYAEVAAAGGGGFRNSVTSVSETVADFALNTMDHVFDPLPTDVRHVDLRVSIVPVLTKGEEYQEEVHLDVVVDRKVPIIGYVILVSGLIALSSIGAALDLQGGGVTPEMKIFWRLNSTSILFLWLCAKKLNREELARFSRFQLLVELPFAAANYALMNTTFAVSLEMTSLVNAFILSNMASLLMIGGKFALGIKVLFFEGLGALIGFAGALICAAAGSGEETNNDHRAMLQIEGEGDASMGNLEMMGNALAFSASVGTAIYLVVAKRLRPCVDLVLFMFLIFTLASVFLLLYIILYSGQEYELSLDPRIGLFGWVNLQADRLPLELYVAIVCNGVGTMGYIAIMKYFDPVVVSMVMLTEPIIATFIGLAVGVSTLPGWATWAGDAVVMVGSIMVIYTGSKKTETIDATDAIQKCDDDAVGTIESPKLTKSPCLRRSKMMKSPLIVGRQRVDTEEMEFVSVGKKSTRAPSTRGSGHGRVIWSSMKS